MATILIPITLDAAYSTQRVRLDGRDYVLEIAYNQREDRWFVSILDDEENPLVMGLKMVTNFPLLRRYQSDPRVPPGELMAMTLGKDKSPPGFSEFGQGRRVELNYFEKVTVDAISPPKKVEPKTIGVYLTLTATTSGGYVGDTAYAIAVETQLNARFPGVKSVSATSIETTLNASGFATSAGTSSVSVTGLGFVPSPPFIEVLSTGSDYLLTFAHEHIVVSS